MIPGVPHLWFPTKRRFTPASLPGLAAWYSADFGVLNSVGPDVPATDGQTVRRWLDRSGNARHLNQTVLASQPIFTNATTGITFDGSNDVFDVTNGGSLFQSKGYGYVFIVAQDTNPTGGNTFHPLFFNTVGTSTTSSRATISTRISLNQFQIVARRLDAAAGVASIVAPNNSNLNILEGHCLWQENSVFLVINGVSSTPTTLASGAGTTDNTASLTAQIGGNVPIVAYFPGNVREIVVVNEQLSSSQILNTRRYLSTRWGVSV